MDSAYASSFFHFSTVSLAERLSAKMLYSLSSSETCYSSKRL